MKSPRVTFLVLLLMISACASRNAGGPVSTSIAEDLPEMTAAAGTQPSPTKASTRLPPASPTSAQPELPLSQYNLSAALDYDTHHLVVEERIDYVNRSGEPIPELLLLVEPNRYTNGFLLKALNWGDGTAVPNYTLTGAELSLPLSEFLAPGGSLSLSLTYELNLPQQNAPYGYTDRQTNLGDWYPYIPPYIADEGYVAHQDAPMGEHLAYETADFQVQIQLAQPSAASGQPLTIAASALPQVEGETYRYRLAAARNFAWTVSPLYQVQETKVGDITVSGYSFPNHPSADGPALQETAKALTAFDLLFSPYPHDSLAVVEADFLDGMEYDGLIFLSHAFYDFYTGDAKSNLTIIAAHEVAHQWWYGLVGNDQALEPWLDEALSTYSELFFYEKAYPELVDWYWENRITFHNPQGWVDSTIYDTADFYPYRDAVYLRGAMFLNDLRSLMGDEAFFAFLRDYLAQYTHRQATGGDFFAVLAQHTNADLSPLIGSYFTNR